MHLLVLATALLLSPSTYTLPDAYAHPRAESVGTAPLGGPATEGEGEEGSDGGAKGGSEDPTASPRSGPVAFAEQLADFQALGIRLNPEVRPADVSALWGEDAYVQSPYAMLYVSLGSPTEQTPLTPISDQAW